MLTIRHHYRPPPFPRRKVTDNWRRIERILNLVIVITFVALFVLLAIIITQAAQ